MPIRLSARLFLSKQSAILVAAIELAGLEGDFIPLFQSEEKLMYDMKNLSKIKVLEEKAAETAKAFWAFDKAAMSEGAISVKNKELMALAVAFTTQCPYCIEIHAKRARTAGANDAEISEVVFIAAALRAGAAVTHGTHAFV
ncbi:MAG TPA: carboxymuconolactone decarboxylase family protein [Acidobacteriaceae bacterium]|nr:carboxymuconolactone decarboxylase family protein [Acidobacteriaceae bacterium]